jgi:hypothetical protein
MAEEGTAAKGATAPGKMTLVESLINRGGKSQAGSDPAGPPASVEIEAGVLVDFLIERDELDNEDGTQDGEAAHRTHPAEANNVKKWQKVMGFRGSALKKGGKAKKFLRKAGNAAKLIIPILFLHDWYERGFWEATKNTANDALWPLSELWN